MPLSTVSSKIAPQKILTRHSMIRHTLIGCTALVLAAIAVPMAYESYARWTAQADVARFVSRTAGLSVGGMDLDARGILTLRDVAFTHGATQVRARRVNVPISLDHGFWLAAPALADPAVRLAQWPAATPNAGDGIELKIPGQTATPATPQAAPSPPPGPTPVPAGQPGTASATDVTVTTAAAVFTIKSIDLTGTTLSNADLASLLDPKNGEPTVERLKKVNATSITIPSIIREVKGTGERTEVTQVLLGNVVAGKIGTANAAGVVQTSKTATTDSILKTGTLQASGLDLTLFAQLVGTRRTDDATPLKPMIDTLTITDLFSVIHDTAGLSTTTIATIAEKNVMARPLKSDPNVLDVPGDEVATADNQKAFLDDVLNSFSFGSVSFEKLVLAMSGLKDPLNVSIGKTAFENYRDRSFGGFTMRDVLVTRTNGKGSFATLDLAGLVLPVFAKADVDPAAPFGAGVPTLAKFDLTLLDIDAPSDDEATTSKVKFKIGHVGGTGDQTSGPGAKQGTLAVDNLTFDVPKQAPVGKEFDAMGYTHVDLSSAIDASYDQATETLTVPKIQVSGVDMGSAKVALDLANVSKRILSTNQEISKAAAITILLKRIDLKLVNGGLFEKALAFTAKRDGNSVEAERDLGIDFFGTKLPEAMGNGPGIKAVGSAVVTFFKDPKSLHVLATSKEGLGAADFAMVSNPDDILSRLDIKAEADK